MLTGVPSRVPTGRRRSTRADERARILWAAAAAAALAAPAMAQRQFEPLGKQALPFDPAGNSTAVAWGDVDRDGDLDLVVGNAGSQIRLYTNSGIGYFTDVTARQLPWAPLDVTSIAAADFDGDGDVDLVVGETNAYFFQYQNQEWTRLYLNDGTGTLSLGTGLPAVIGATASLALADGDGDLDLLVGRGRNLFGGSSHDDYFENAGNGTFTLATGKTPLTGGGTSSVTFADMDRDGDADIVVVKSLMINGTTFEVFSNLVRQLDAPLLLRIGRSYPLAAYARYGPPHSNDVVVPMVAPLAANFVFPPFGIVGIDPGSAVVLPAVAVPQPAGVATLALSVPLVPSALGAQLHFQALHLRPPLSSLLTNVVTETVTH